MITDLMRGGSPYDDESGLESIRQALKNFITFGAEIRILSKEHNGSWSWGVYLNYKAHEISVHGEAPTPGRAMTMALDLAASEYKKKYLGGV